MSGGSKNDDNLLSLSERYLYAVQILFVGRDFYKGRTNYIPQFFNLKDSVTFKVHGICMFGGL